MQIVDIEAVDMIACCMYAIDEILIELTLIFDRLAVVLASGKANVFTIPQTVGVLGVMVRKP